MSNHARHFKYEESDVSYIGIYASGRTKIVITQSPNDKFHFFKNFDALDADEAVEENPDVNHSLSHSFLTKHGSLFFMSKSSYDSMNSENKPEEISIMVPEGSVVPMELHASDHSEIEINIPAKGCRIEAQGNSDIKLDNVCDGININAFGDSKVLLKSSSTSVRPAIFTRGRSVVDAGNIDFKDGFIHINGDSSVTFRSQESCLISKDRKITSYSNKNSVTFG